MLNNLSEHLKIAAQKIKIQKFVPAIIFFSVLLLVGYSIVKEKDLIINYSWHIKFQYLIISILAYCLELALLFLGWEYILTSLTGFGNWRARIYVFFVSILGKRVPTPVFYLGSRFSMYKSQDISRKTVALSSIIESSLIILAGTLILGVSFPFVTDTLIRGIGIYSLVVGALFLIILMLFPKVFVKLINFFLNIFKRPIITLDINRLDLLKWLFIYVISGILSGISFYFCLLGLVNMAIPFFDIFSISFVYLIVSNILSFFSLGFGIKEVVASELLKPWQPFSVSIILLFVFRLLMIFVEWIIAFIIGKLYPPPAEQ